MLDVTELEQLSENVWKVRDSTFSDELSRLLVHEDKSGEAKNAVIFLNKIDRLDASIDGECFLQVQRVKFKAQATSFLADQDCLERLIRPSLKELIKNCTED